MKRSGRSPQTSRICSSACVATVSTCSFVHVQLVQLSGRSPQTSRFCSRAYVTTLSTCHFAHVQMDSHTCHSCSFYFDICSLRDIRLRARSLYDGAIHHEVNHPRSRASSTPASPVVKNDFVAIIQATRLCTPPQCATTQAHSSPIHQDERTFCCCLPQSTTCQRCHQ